MIKEARDHPTGASTSAKFAASDDTRHRILRSALRVFAEFGYTGASTREIARRAGLKQPSLVYFFPNKEELWKAVAAYAFAELETTLAKVTDTSLPQAIRRHAMIEGYVRFAASNPEWSMLLLHETMHDSDRSRWAGDRFLHPLVRWWWRSLTDRPWPMDSEEVMSAFQIVSFLGNSVVTVTQRVQNQIIAGIDTTSEQFILRRVAFLNKALDYLIQEHTATYQPDRASDPACDKHP